MQKDNYSLSQRENDHATAFTKFLWWLATAEEDIIRDCRIDRNRYAITGYTVLGTWLFATLAWFYFFYTVVNQVIPALLLGIFMGGIILGIDRALIKGINARNKKKFIPLLFRGLLAITIGTFMAQPALLYLFDKEIHVQISLDNVQKIKEKQNKLDSLNAPVKNELLAEKKLLSQSLSDKYNEVTNARNNFIAETDGSGGSGKIGLKDIARAKQNEYEKIDSAYLDLHAQTTVQLKSIDSSLEKLSRENQKEMAAFSLLLNDGFLTRIEGLHHLLQNNSAAQSRYYLLILILVLIELMPVIAKTILPNGTYDERIFLREQLEKEMAHSNISKEKALKELYNHTAFENDRDFIQHFFEKTQSEREEKLLNKLSEWKNNGDGPFDHMWNDIKRNFLSKQEN
ncbi:MAG: DUF4407 domain-containing protein [Bacteroidetes bacterium]|nr:DUF4407 domain-containing protein [Bacteroidota bacterium]